MLSEQEKRQLLKSQKWPRTCDGLDDVVRWCSEELSNEEELVLGCSTGNALTCQLHGPCPGIMAYTKTLRKDVPSAPVWIRAQKCVETTRAKSWSPPSLLLWHDRART